MSADVDNVEAITMQTNCPVNRTKYTDYIAARCQCTKGPKVKAGVFYNNNIGKCTADQVAASDSRPTVAGTFVWSVLPCGVCVMSVWECVGVCGSVWVCGCGWVWVVRVFVEGV